jgi:hypothetical protein
MTSAPASPQPSPSPGGPDVSWLIRTAILAAAVGVAAFLVGRSTEASKYDPGEPKYQAIYDAGAKAARSAGRAKGRAEGLVAGRRAGLRQGEARGQASGQRVGLEQGTAQGLRLGRREGESAGIAQGREEGARRGALAALGGFASWQDDAPYVVQYTPGTVAEVPFRVGSRLKMEPRKLYGICDTGDGVCAVARKARAG